EDLDGEISETKDEETSMRHFINRSEDVDEMLIACCSVPTALLKVPEFGVSAFWAVEFGGDPADLSFEIGSDFAESVNAMNYGRLPGHAKRCLRNMALIAGGRGSEVDGHEARTGQGGNDPVLRDSKGDAVMRSRLGNNTPDAHRLFWVRGQRAE